MDKNKTRQSRVEDGRGSRSRSAGGQRVHLESTRRDILRNNAGYPQRASCSPRFLRSKANRLLNISNCFSFDTSLGSFRSATTEILGAPYAAVGPVVLRLSGGDELTAAGDHESGMKFVSFRRVENGDMKEDNEEPVGEAGAS